MADSADERVHEDTKIMRQRLRERLDSAVENGDDVVTVSLAETRALLTGLGHAPLERAAIVRYLRGEGADLYAALIEDGAQPKRPPELSPEERKKRADQRDRGVLNDGNGCGPPSESGGR